MSLTACATVAVATFPNRAVATTAGSLPLPVVMVAIAGAESGWRDNAAGDYGLPGPTCSGYTSWGLWQIHSVHSSYLLSVTGSYNPCYWAQWLYVPANCARAALSVYTSQGLTAWSTYNDGRWAANIAKAQAAVAAAGQPVAGSSGGGGSTPGGGTVSGGGSTPGGARPRTALNLGVWGGLAVVLFGGGAILDGLRRRKT